MADRIVPLEGISHAVAAAIGRAGGPALGAASAGQTAPRLAALCHRGGIEQTAPVRYTVSAAGQKGAGWPVPHPDQIWRLKNAIRIMGL